MFLNTVYKYLHACPCILITVVLILLLKADPAIANSRSEPLASVLREVTGQLEKFNSLYIGKLERELFSTSSRLSAMESTLRSIADRALAWDNIQNHMAVWTDQTRTMEKKLDMLNRCHEKQAGWEGKLSAVDALNHKLTALDKKINAMSRLEFKVEKVSERVEEMNSKLKFLQESASSSRPEQPLLTQLAKRGLLSYFGTVEAKLDNISDLISGQRTIHKYHSPRIFGTRSSSSWHAETASGIQSSNKEIQKCFMSTHHSQLLEDVGAKVDRLFDKAMDPEYEYDNFVGNLKRQAPSPPVTLRSEGGSDFDSNTEHVFARFWKSLFAPFKKMNRRFRTFETQLNNIEQNCNRTSVGSIDNANLVKVEKILVSRMNAVDEVLRHEMDETRLTVRDQSSHIDKLIQTVANAGYLNKQLTTDVTRQFEAQRAIMQSSFQELKSLIFQYCNKDSSTKFTPNQPRIATSTTIAPTLPAPVFPTMTPATFPNNRSKSDVDCSDYVQNYDLVSDVFSLSDVSDDNAADRDFYERYCDQETDGGGWTVIQRRGISSGEVKNFNVSWDEYKHGFGDLRNDFWWGNDFIHRLSNQDELTLRFDLWDFDGNYAFAEYSSFKIGSEEDNYVLSVSGYRGNASDSFSAHNGYSFSTFDRDNDKAPECCPCAPAYGGGWWFYSCFESNLNGEYHLDPNDNDYYRGLIWELWLGDYSLRATEIKVRPASFSQPVFPTPFSGSDPKDPFSPELP